MADLLVEIDISELLDIGGMSLQKPVLRDPAHFGSLLEITDDVLDIQSFTKTGFADRVVVKNSNGKELDIIDDLELGGLNNTSPVLRSNLIVNHGNMNQIPLGAQSPLPGDTLTLIDFAENTRTHTVQILNGVIQSWSTVERGTRPIVPNLHTITMLNGAIQSWDITPAGLKPSPLTNSVHITKGLIQEWTQTPL